MKRVNILNASIDNLSKQELLEKLNEQGGIVVTPNVDHLMLMQKDAEFYKIYNQSNYKVCDSKIIFYASRLLGCPIREKISGSDFFPAFYEHNKKNEEIKIFLMGAQEGVAKKAQERINQKVKREIIVEAYSPSFGFEKNEKECEKIVDRINNSGATVLAIGVGTPKQEKWIFKYKDRLKNIKIFLAIGATIDFEAGNKVRAPKWMSELGIEWLYRLMQEPRRLWKRYLVEDLPFLWLVFKQKLNLYKDPQYQEWVPDWSTQCQEKKFEKPSQVS
ncbi:WecB/TagA/CpsF family glycosyltransferase [Microseira wollei]|uniref:Glycosyl transferase, WecB/TagA/CpsF family protein n=1 Tax=Microseira wollei NIES-4236 TaxID=2530354 RepID=A0AAV3X9A9_9CYAN|nr:WecB/TagA/CpsF family glycosyltransferase [Microseira wollei]GET39407.1 glycosyl transferase, WecB/TagA/CpsF family protein [Microseira wollei NIES-4236]